MGDVHYLPLRGHDLPEPPRKARVRSYTVGNDRYWTWEHDCFLGRAREAGHDTWRQALRRAGEHLRECL